jgi:hypothetical protein
LKKKIIAHVASPPPSARRVPINITAMADNIMAHKWGQGESERDCDRGSIDEGYVRLSYKLYFFSKQIVFFSHNKSANNTFSHGFSAKRTWPKQVYHHGPASRIV